MSDHLFKTVYLNSPSVEAKDNWIYITTIGHYSHKPEEIPFYRGSEPGYQFLLTLSGEGWIDYDGKYQIVRPGTIMCINLEKGHGIDAIEGEPWCHYYLILGGRIFEYIYKQIFENNNIVEIINNDFYKCMFEKIIKIKKEEPIYFDIKAMSIVLEMLSNLLDTSLSSNKKVASVASIEKVISYIKENYQKEINVNELSMLSSYSKYHFSRIFKEHTGLSPNEYIIKVRIENSKYFLKNTLLPLAVIATKCGFCNQQYFCKIFKSREKITPIKYKRMSSF